MAVFRVHKNKDFTTIDNNIFKNKDMSYKTTGLLCTMLSLPDGWNFSISGLVALKKDKDTTVRTALKELEELGYLTRTKVRNKSGVFVDWQYDIYEKPVVDYPQVEKPQVDKPHVENHTLLNTNKLNTKELNTKKYIFIKPSLDEVKEYCKERNNNVNPNQFIDFYESKGWMVGKNKMKDWKACVRTWERNNKSDKSDIELPEWLNRDLNKEFNERYKEMDDILKEIGG